jgi:V8-like Glu-specific endopeptidase
MSANRSVCQLRATLGGGTIAGTCWFAGQDRLVTAAHNVHDGAEVTVRLPQGGSLEFGKAQIAVFPGYAEALAHPRRESPFNFDVALLKLPLPHPPATPLDWEESSPAAIKGNTVEMCGYPDDDVDQRCISAQASVPPDPKLHRLVQYQKSTKRGQSGGPVTVDGGQTAVAIHVQGFQQGGRAVVLDTEVATFLRTA